MAFILLNLLWKLFLELSFFPLLQNKIVKQKKKKKERERLNRKRPDIKDVTIAYFKFLSQNSFFFKKKKKKKRNKEELPYFKVWRKQNKWLYPWIFWIAGSSSVAAFPAGVNTFWFHCFWTGLWTSYESKEKEAMCIETILFLMQYLVEHQCSFIKSKFKKKIVKGHGLLILIKFLTRDQIWLSFLVLWFPCYFVIIEMEEWMTDM